MIKLAKLMILVQITHRIIIMTPLRYSDNIYDQTSKDISPNYSLSYIMTFGRILNIFYMHVSIVFVTGHYLFIVIWGKENCYITLYTIHFWKKKWNIFRMDVFYTFISFKWLEIQNTYLHWQWKNENQRIPLQDWKCTKEFLSF